MYNLLKKEFNKEFNIDVTDKIIDFFCILDRYNNCSVSGKASLENSEMKLYMVLTDENENEISDPLEYSGNNLLEIEKFINFSYKNLKEIYWNLDDNVTGDKYKR